MFTGIVTDIGQVLSVTEGGVMRVRIATTYDADSIDIGASIACSGVCLTVVSKGHGAEGDARNWFDVDISGETLAKTTLGGWMPGRRVNLERSLRLGDEMGGHIVSGHVDGVAEVIAMMEEGDSLRLRFRAPLQFAGYVAPKGSIALNGTSLTVNEVDGADFGVNLIPHTLHVTTWGDVAVGDWVNFEIDTLARYVARLNEWNRHK